MSSIDPTRPQFDAFKALPRDTTIHMLNLIRLRPLAAYPEDHPNHGKGLTGLEELVSGSVEDASVAFFDQDQVEKISQAAMRLPDDFRDVIKTRIYVIDPSHWVDSGRAHAEVFKDIRPALGWVYMSAFFNPDILVEVECTAYRAS
jgi:enamine deaminase RidA (YjgF/YER057c/UK114 family)